MSLDVDNSLGKTDNFNVSQVLMIISFFMLAEVHGFVRNVDSVNKPIIRNIFCKYYWEAHDMPHTVTEIAAWQHHC